MMKPIGSAERFAALRAELARRGARNPDALALTIGKRALSGGTRLRAMPAAPRRRGGGMAATVSKHPVTGRFQSHKAPSVEGSPVEERGESAAIEAAEMKRKKKMR